MSTAAVPHADAPSSPGRGVVLEARNIVMRFGGLTAVDDVSFQVHEGEIVGLIGPNGAGKTTFFNCLTGMYKPTSGEVTLGGRALPPRPRAVVTAGMARTFQNIRLFGNMTALENVMVGRYCRTSSMALTSILRGPKFRREERESIDRGRELLRFVGLDDKADHLARNLPYGEQRRLEIARALATEPQVVLLDEPTAGMNPRETEEAMRLIFRIRELGMAVVVIEHDMRFIFTLCDRVLCLVRGALLVEGSPAQVQSDPRVIEAYIGGSEDDDISADELTEEDVEVLHAEGVDVEPSRTSARSENGR
ncbi:ABC transporter ATP-binding protein [Marihabitans asiaticum]|uniref:Amino acid/amide ABC transporter ATP-binding protein 1 (HAAT family) n=1 Tax=Marihabitans asiaticum TaxID=415218 RepID=A0A560WAY5_9MICO|nr:ABC transporter ATP-binding protein [Marihabitans asiaticum]TWD14756.1 amino acid/amide ABC transporter ATP-binding protein 1 (HAAT family) [Marihabitans asiaticum]